MDGVIGALIQRLKDYNLFDSTNLMIVNIVYFIIMWSFKITLI